ALRIAAGGRCGLVATGLLRGAPRRDPALELLTLLRRDRIALCRKFVGELLGAEAFRPVEAGQRAALLEVVGLRRRARSVLARREGMRVQPRLRCGVGGPGICRRRIALG